MERYIFGNLSNVEALTFSGNFLTGPIPRSFENLLKLRELSVQLNALDGKIDFLAKLNITCFISIIIYLRRRISGYSLFRYFCYLLSGPIPFNKHWERIEGYEVYHNYFSSSLPSFTNISQMIFMTAISNYLTLTIPSDLFAHTRHLYYVGLSENLLISHNALMGTIPQAIQIRPWLSLDGTINCRAL